MAFVYSSSLSHMFYCAVCKHEHVYTELVWEKWWKFPKKVTTVLKGENMRISDLEITVNMTDLTFEIKAQCHGKTFWRRYSQSDLSVLSQMGVVYLFSHGDE